MSKDSTSKLVAGGRRALVRLGLAVGAVFALPRAHKAWARLTLRAKPPSGEASVGNGTGGNGVPVEAEAAQRAMEGPEMDALGRAENEGMHRGRW